MTIEEARKNKGLSRKDVAEWLEIPYRTLQNWEMGERVCPPYVEKLVVEKVLRDAPNEKVPNRETLDAFAESGEMKKNRSGQHYDGSTKEFLNKLLED